jgi:hypothetical protein
MASPIKDKQTVSPIKENNDVSTPSKNKFDETSITPSISNGISNGVSSLVNSGKTLASGSGSGSAVVSGSAWIFTEKIGGDGHWMSSPEKPYNQLSVKAEREMNLLSLKQREQQVLYAETNPAPPKEEKGKRRLSNSNTGM